MNQQYHLLYPTVDLFIYDLQQGLGQQDEEINQNRHHFWRKVKPELNKDYHQLNPQQQEVLNKLASLERTEADYVELLLPEKHQKFQPDLEGYYYALQLGDVYALQVDCSVIDDRICKSISRFQDIKQNIESRIHHQQGKIGQTWFVWGQLQKDYSSQQIKAIALECYSQIHPKINPNSQVEIDIKNQGKFLGATAFEVWVQPTNWADANSFADSFHLLICLFGPQQSFDDIQNSIAGVYFDLIRLFCYRHKILWAYHQSRFLKSKLKKDFHDVQKSVNKVSELGQQINHAKPNLQELQKTLTDTLTILSRYAIDLSYLDDQGRTIRVNLDNYKKRLDKISRENHNSDLQFLQQFSEFSASKYLLQVETDYINLSPGLTLLQNLISTIQGTIDIYQTKSDRALDNTIALAGIGLAVSGLTATAISAKQPPITSYKDISFLASPVFVWSIAFSAPFLIALILRLFRR
ncbi:hypothetical protein [Fischerella sp. PCC 9605]|uniref:hypothetical protein n=1 Tax=Fischerella sp. PCC 9605 TaxID=1173024 RepID=UPI00047ACC2E|nr:hypothetical protein [Fischerella sp. PCC 9605]